VRGQISDSDMRQIILSKREPEAALEPKPVFGKEHYV
jgi:hypothetical protein